MPRADVKIAPYPDQGAGEPDQRYRITVGFQEITVSAEELGEIGQTALSKLGCSFEIRWPSLEPTLDERIKLRQEALARRRGAAEEYVAKLESNRAEPFGEVTRARLVEAYIAGHDDSPKPLNHPYR